MVADSTPSSAARQAGGEGGAESTTLRWGDVAAMRRGDGSVREEQRARPAELRGRWESGKGVGVGGGREGAARQQGGRGSSAGGNEGANCRAAADSAPSSAATCTSRGEGGCRSPRMSRLAQAKLLARKKSGCHARFRMSCAAYRPSGSAPPPFCREAGGQREGWRQRQAERSLRRCLVVSTRHLLALRSSPHLVHPVSGVALRGIQHRPGGPKQHRGNGPLGLVTGRCGAAALRSMKGRQKRRPAPCWPLPALPPKQGQHRQ